MAQPFLVLPAFLVGALGIGCGHRAKPSRALGRGVPRVVSRFDSFASILLPRFFRICRIEGCRTTPPSRHHQCRAVKTSVPTRVAHLPILFAHVYVARTGSKSHPTPLTPCSILLILLSSSKTFRVRNTAWQLLFACLASRFQSGSHLPLQAPRCQPGR